MEIVGRKIILKFTRGDATLEKAFNDFLAAVTAANWQNDADVKNTFHRADRILGGFYVFDIGSNHNLSLVLFNKGQFEIIWAGNHDDYEATFKNNKDTIKKFLKKKGYNL
jgi:mRNA interferase HigB